MKIGIVDLDTSHPQSWIPIERELGHEVVGLWDGGSVHPKGYAEEFAKKMNIGKVFGSLEEMAAEVDCAIIHGCDWDTHVAKAHVFVKAGKGVLLDKPVVGKMRDVNQLRAWVRQGARISGGSSLRFCVESQAWLAKPVDERGTPQTVVAGCAVDEYNYGVHAYSLLTGLIGTGAKSVRHLGKGLQHRVQINFGDGRMGIVIVGKTAKWLPFYATIATEKSITQFIADNSKLYRALLEKVLPYLGGAVADPPAPFDELIEPELCAMAARRSWQEGDREVALAELSESDAGYDGAAFAVEYRIAKYGK